MDAQGSQLHAKEDTAFLADTTLSTDLSQWGTNITASGAGAYESNSTRTGIISERNLYLRWEYDAADAGGVALLYHGNTTPSTATYAIRTNASSKLELLHGAFAVIWTSAAALTTHDYSISWSMRDNPLTTGAANAKQSIVWLYDHTAGSTVEISSTVHAAPTTNAAWNFSVGGLWNGATLLFPPTNAPTVVRVSRAFHHHVEDAEEWAAARLGYSGTADDGAIEPIGPVAVSSELANSGEWAGRHPWGWTAAHTDAIKRHAWSPLINEVRSDAYIRTATPAPAWWATPSPGQGSATMMIGDLRWVPVPAGSTHGWVRVHVVSYVTAGAAVPVLLRVVSMNRPPNMAVIDGKPAPALEYRYKDMTFTVNHGSAAGTGAWIEFGDLSLAVFDGSTPGWKNTTWICLAYQVDPAGVSGNDANARLVIDAVHVRPAFRQVPQGLDP